jgi:hypothetical protein
MGHFMTGRLGDSIVASGANIVSLRVALTVQYGFGQVECGGYVGRESGKKARQVRSGKTATFEEVRQPMPDTSDQALAALLKRLKATTDPDEIGQLSVQIE